MKIKQISDERLTREFAENFLDFFVAFSALKINLEFHYGYLNKSDRSREGSIKTIR